MTSPTKTHGKTRDEWDKMCLTKRRFPDEHVARASICEGMQKQRIKAEKLWIYQCPSCRGWHMTSKNNHGDKSPAVTGTDPYAED